MSFYWINDNKIEIHTFESLSLREQEEVTKSKVKESLIYLSSRFQISPKGAPHIFEYVVGPGVFSLDPAKPEKGKVAPLTLRTELYGLLNPEGLSMA